MIHDTAKVWHPEKSVLLACEIGRGCTVHAMVWIGNNVVIGNHCKIQAFTFIPEGVTIGDRVFIGPHVCFTNDRHPPSDEWTQTFVEDDVSIGAGAVITPGIRIGAGARIAAGAVVTRDIAPGEHVRGVPARNHPENRPDGHFNR